MASNLAMQGCACGHSLRRHEDGGEGACKASGCGCSQSHGVHDFEKPGPAQALAAVPDVPAEPVAAPARRQRRAVRSGETFTVTRTVVDPVEEALVAPADWVASVEAEVDALLAASVEAAAADELVAAPAVEEAEPDDGLQECWCGERVVAVSSRGLCDGCEEEAERASAVAEAEEDPFVADLGLLLAWARGSLMPWTRDLGVKVAADVEVLRRMLTQEWDAGVRHAAGRVEELSARLAEARTALEEAASRVQRPASWDGPSAAHSGPPAAGAVVAAQS